MTDRLKNLLTLALAAGLLYGFLIWGVLRPDVALSVTERRPLTQRPQITVQTALNGQFAEHFARYTLDQFPLRDDLRTLKSLTGYYLLRQSDQHGIYLAQGRAAKLDYPLHEDSVNYALSRFSYLYDTLLAVTDARVYAAVVPDKGYYLAEANGYPAMDYETLFRTVAEQMPWAQHIDLTPYLTADSYYTTDAHWRQECLPSAANALANAMGVNLADTEYTEITADAPFYGVYAGQSALPLAPDALRYLTSETLDACRVYDYETDSWLPVYDGAQADGDDPYALFLSGSKSLLRLENPNAATDRELIVFRDSFGSSLAPLLASGYKTITLVDIRYLAPERLPQYLTVTDQDVLFLYSTTVLNNSDAIK